MRYSAWCQLYQFWGPTSHFVNIDPVWNVDHVSATPASSYVPTRALAVYVFDESKVRCTDVNHPTITSVNAIPVVPVSGFSQSICAVLSDANHLHPWHTMYTQQHPSYLPTARTTHYQLPYSYVQLRPIIPPQGPSSIPKACSLSRTCSREEVSVSNFSKQEQQIPERCIACAKSLTDNPKEWSDSPSLASSAWPPQRCARCKRHFLIFAHEWPQRSANERNSGLSGKIPFVPRKWKSLQCYFCLKKTAFLCFAFKEKDSWCFSTVICEGCCSLLFV